MAAEAGTSAPASLTNLRVLITGARGFVGRRLCAALAQRGAVVLAAARGEDRRRVSSGGPTFDLLDVQGTLQAVASARPDVVIHLAAQSSVGQGMVNAAETWTINLTGSLNLARAIAEHAPKATVLFSSTAEVYGDAFLSGKANEDTQPAPRSVYARSKRAAEEMFADVLRSTNQLIVARPANHSGQGQDDRFVAPAFARQIMSGDTVRVGNLEAFRDFLHVDDVVEAYLALLAARHRIDARVLVNIASGAPVRIGFILERLIALSGGTPEVVSDLERTRPSEIQIAAVDAARMHDLTGWAPKISLDEMLADVLKGAESQDQSM